MAPALISAPVIPMILASENRFFYDLHHRINIIVGGEFVFACKAAFFALVLNLLPFAAVRLYGLRHHQPKA